MDEKFVEYYESLYEKRPQEPETQEDVKRILHCLRVRNGYLEPDDEAILKQQHKLFRTRMQLHASELRQQRAKYTKDISSQLYDNPFHFFYELVQNADDAKYTIASHKDEKPCLTLRVGESELLVDSNEDGFTLADVLAICSTGSSSKVQDSETTGEKGYGFKAVFAVASKVTVQSGLWSFGFEHDRLEDGLGMITPLWQKPTTLPQGVRTRFTLNYGNTDDTTLDCIFQQLNDQPVTILAFLRRIRTIKFVFKDVPSQYDKRTFTALPALKKGYERFSETLDGEKQIHYFRACTKMVKDMPERDGRSHAGSSPVSILFPVSDHKTCEPLIDPSGQFVFAYLPVRQIPQIPFVIQGDFILTASRQDVSDNAWNRKLRQGLALLFKRAVRQFAEESDYALCYQWLQYLPGSHIAGFWSSLLSQIRNELSKVKPFLSITGQLISAAEARSLPEEFLHSGEPILQNESMEYSYLSLEYDVSLDQALRSLGVQPLSREEMTFQITADASSDFSTLHESDLTEPWHVAFSGLVCHLLSPKGSRRPEYDPLIDLKDAKIVPVRDSKKGHSWIAPNDRTIYLPVMVDEQSETESIQILMPKGLGFPVVHPDACEARICKQAYQKLGVIDASRVDVCKSIIKRHSSQKAEKMSKLLLHFELLFWCNHISSSLPRLYAKGMHGDNVFADRLFFHSDSAFHVAKLLRPGENKQYARYFLHKSYQKSQVANKSWGSRTWTSWLEKVAGVRWYPPLEDPDHPGKLHPLIYAINENNPENLLPMLQQHWSSSYEKAINQPAVRQSLLELDVLCRHGSRNELQDETWFPSSDIISMAQVYNVEDELDIIRLPNSDAGCELSSWPSLAALQIPATVNLEFIMLILERLSVADVQLSPEFGKLSKLYNKLGSMATFQHVGSLKRSFEMRALIWSPFTASWLTSSDCVWQSPVLLQRKFVITSSYAHSNAKSLFRTFLGIGNATLEHLIEELEGMSHSQTAGSIVRNGPQITRIYSAMEEMATSAEIKEKLRVTFLKKPLICIDGLWYTTTECIWHESAAIGDYSPIQSYYPDQADFFVSILGVREVTGTFMIDELARIADDTEKEWEVIKQIMLNTGSILRADDDVEGCEESLATLRVTKFLPCLTSTAEREFLSFDDTFFILDDDRYTHAFTGKLPVLDFTYAETNTLHNLLNLFGITDRYLSFNVEHVTEEGDSSKSEQLTRQLRQCAYSISCCAVFHYSPLYLKQVFSMHQKLMNLDVYTSANIHTTFLVTLGDDVVKAEADKAYLKLTSEPEKLRIVVPQTESDQAKCFRTQLPKELGRLLKIESGAAIHQIHRFINELNEGTDQLMKEEGIPHADGWLTKTERLPSPATDTGFSETPGVSRQYSQAVLPVYIEDEPVPDFGSHANTTSTSSMRRSGDAAIPARVNHQREARMYSDLLQHLYRQATGVQWRGTIHEQTLLTTSDLSRSLSDLRGRRGASEDPRVYPELFGSDQYHNYRVGAAGELFVFGVLKSVLGNKLTLENWPSSIRHYAQAHPDFQDLSRMTQREIADITYQMRNDDVVNVLYKVARDDSENNDWLPDWLDELPDASSESLITTDSASYDRDTVEWLFEVKTTLGPCDTAFFMSESQYSKMKSAGTQPSDSKKRVYCIVRVYDLLKDVVGIRFFVDPWRFKDTKLEFVGENWRVKAVEEQSAT